jgi:polyphenol oxidase
VIRWRIDGVDAVVTDRWGGVSWGRYESLNLGLHVGDKAELVEENRALAVGLVGGVVDELVTCTQVHGRDVLVVGEAGHAGDADALVTTTPGLVLMVLMADCVPVLLVDPVARVLATVHAGWRGTVADVVGATVETMRSLGASDIAAFLGPAVPVDRYEVGPEVADAAAAVGLAAAMVGDHFDLWAANTILLERAGVTSIDTSGCIATGDDYFSDRAQRPCGRFGLLARLRP